MKGVMRATLIGLLLALTGAAQERKLTNADVVEMLKAGLGAPVVTAKINDSAADFDLSVDSLIALKQAGATDEIVGAMFAAKNRPSALAASPKPVETSSTAAPDPNDPSAPHDYGIYFLDEVSKRMARLTPSISSQNRLGGMFTSGLTYGISKMKLKTNLPGPASAFRIGAARPVFYFYLDTKTGGLNTASGIASTPKELILLKFHVRDDNREVTIAKVNIFGAKGGISDEYVVKVKAEDLGAGVFRVVPEADLKPGEYGFYLVNSGNANNGAGVGSKFFDFGVGGVKP